MKVEFTLNWDGTGSPTYIDYSEFVNLTGFKRNKALSESFDPIKSISAEIEVYGEAYTTIKFNLIDDSNRYSNFYIVKVTDTDCGGTVFMFKVQDEQLRWCDNNECKLRFTLIEYAPQLDCINRTPISDNSTGIFNPIATSGFPHPRFRYCDVVKPTFLYGMIVTFVNAVSAFIASLNLAIASITGIIVWIVNALGGSWTVPSIGFGFAEDMLGCSRGHPAPFVRTYISNVCDLCDVNVTNVSAPILYESLIAGNDNPYYQMCLATAYTTKGCDISSSSIAYIQANAPSWDLGKFISLLKVPFNSRWFIYHDTLYFERKDLIGELIWGSTPAIDLSGADEVNLLGDVCYTYNGQGKPRKLLFNYGTDPSDNIGNELLRRFRCIYEDTSNLNYNETLETNIYEFGATSCVLDGKDSAYDANIDKALSGILTGSSYGGCLKTQGDTFALAKLLIYDIGTGVEDARVYPLDYDLYGSAGANIQSMQDDDANFFPLSSSDCRNYNAPMSFDWEADNVLSSGFRNLWQFNEIDAPNAAKKSNIDIDFKLQYCCDYNTLDIYQTVLLKDGVTEAEIYSIDFDHEKREILIKAKLK